MRAKIIKEELQARAHALILLDSLPVKDYLRATNEPNKESKGKDIKEKGDIEVKEDIEENDYEYFKKKVVNYPDMVKKNYWQYSLCACLEE